MIKKILSFFAVMLKELNYVKFAKVAELMDVDVYFDPHGGMTCGGVAEVIWRYME